MTVRSADPYCTFRFTVDLAESGGASIGGFSDVTGLGAETELEPLREGGLNTGEHQLPGGTRFPSRLVLRQGIGNPALLWSWYMQIMAGTITRKVITVALNSVGSGPKIAWTFRDACPVKWTGPEFHASSSTVAFESIELVHRGFLLPGQES